MRIFTNAMFHTMVSKADTAAAVLEDRGIITEVFKTPPKINDAEIVDLGGCHVYPGFIDTHTHSFEAGVYTFGADMGNAESIDDVLSILSETAPLGGKIFSYRFDENNIREKRFPTEEELDRVLPDIPLFFRRVDGHSSVVNSAARKLIPWTSAPPSGVLRRQTNSEASYWFHTSLDDEAVIEVYRAAAEKALEGGHTVVHTMIGNAKKDPMHYRLLLDSLDRLPVEFIPYPQILDVRTCLELGSPRIGGCIVADGSFGSRTAFLREPYAGMDLRGEPYREQEFWDSLVREAFDAGLQFAVHAIGDAAIEQIVSAYEKNWKFNKSRLPSEIIHNELLPDDLLKREAGLDIAAVMQPMFDRLWGGENQMYASVLGRERTMKCNRFASLVKAGVLVTGGSDWYITEINALKGIHAAVNIHNRAESLEPYEAVKLYTSNAAVLSGDENRFGTIQAGLEANFTCLTEDILEDHGIDSAEVMTVYRLGELRYS